jgi:hypothetical protein
MGSVARFITRRSAERAQSRSPCAGLASAARLDQDDNDNEWPRDIRRAELGPGKLLVDLVQHHGAEKVTHCRIGEQLVDEVGVLSVAADQGVVHGLAERDREIALVVGLGRLLESFVVEQIGRDAVDQVLGVERGAEALVDDLDDG